MRYRKLDDNGDYSFGNGGANFFQDVPEAVGQAIVTRLYLFLGEWFLDTSDGTPWYTEVLGKGTEGSRDLVLQERILGTTGLIELTGYQSSYQGLSRAFSVSLTADTRYGALNKVQIYSPTVYK